MSKHTVASTIPQLFDYALSKTLAKVTKPIPSPAVWIEENFIDPISNNLIVLEPYQKRILRKALQTHNNGRSRYNLVVWSQPKKSGKTAIAAAAGAYVAANIEAPNEISCIANDKEQSAGRIFAAMLPTLENIGWITPVSKKGVLRAPAAYGPNGSVVKAIASNYEKEAGANQGISLWSELWAYKGERLTRLWEEMTPPPTRKFSMRWVETYAGFKGENLLLQNIYLKVFKNLDAPADFRDKKLQPGVVQIWPDLPVYEVGNYALVFWDHSHRMSWQTPEYYASQKDTLRSSTMKRLHGNIWVDSSESFITEEMWRTSTRVMPDMTGQLTYALDGSKNGDSTALVGTKRVGNLIHTADVHIWGDFSRSATGEVDYSDVETTIVELHRAGKLKSPLWYDEYQMAYLAQRLRLKKVPCKEFSQASERIKSDTFLGKLYNEGVIISLPHAGLRSHVLAADVKYYDNDRVRIIKPAISPGTEEGIILEYGKDQLAAIKKVDAAVAQSMSAYRAWYAKSGGWGLSGS